MKPVRLHLQGFTAFHNPVTVDFAGRKLFAITGPTGAGKSSLLDAMIWALFGKVPRVGREIVTLVSHGANLARVQLEFEARGQRYLVARVRPIKGVTTARLERMHANGDAEPLADSVNEVNAHVEALLGINYDTFVKTIILPQGEFSAFLSGDPKDKKDVLSKLLALDVYKSMMQSANSRANGAKSAADLLQQQHDQIEYQSPEALTAIEAQLHSAEERRQQLEARQANLKRLEAAAADLVTRMQAADAASLTAIDATSRARDAARAAEEAAAALEAATVAQEALSQEIAALDYDAEAHALAKRQFAAAEQLAVARAHLEVAEREVVAARAAEAQATADAEQHRRAVTEAQAILAAARGALIAVAAPATAAAAHLEEDARGAERERTIALQKSHEFELRAAQLQNLAGTAIALRRDLEAADSEVQRATAAAATAEAARAQSAATETAAAADLEAAQQHLEAARVQDAAAAILATIEVGDPCPVCGEPITDLKPHAAPDLDAAEAALVTARKAHAEAQVAHQQAASAAAAAHAHANAARAAFAGFEAKQTALDEALAAASATRANVDRSAKRASTAAAAERDRAIETQRRAEASTQAARVLRVLLVKVPHDLAAAAETAAPAETPSVADIESLAATLGGAIEEHATASNCATSAATAVAEAEAHIATAAAEVKTATALQEHQVHGSRERDAGAGRPRGARRCGPGSASHRPRGTRRARYARLDTRLEARAGRAAARCRDGRRRCAYRHLRDQRARRPRR